MARYRCTKVSFHDGVLCPVGSIVEFDGKPGSNLEPLDDEARAAKDGADASRPAARPGSLKEGGQKLVEIPDDWAEKPPLQIISLARQLGAPAKGTTRETATTFIKDELARRATV